MRDKYSEFKEETKKVVEEVMKAIREDDSIDLTFNERVDIRTKISSTMKKKDEEIINTKQENDSLSYLLEEQKKIIEEKNNIIEEKNKKIAEYEEREKDKKINKIFYVSFLVVVTALNLVSSETALDGAKSILDFLIEIFSSLFI